MVFVRLATLSALLAATAEAASKNSGATVKVNLKTKYQKYDGTGVSEAFQRSLVLHELDVPSQKLALDYLFTTKGAGMTILRNGLGSSPNDGWDLMKSIAPEAPASNSSQVRMSAFWWRSLLRNICSSITFPYQEMTSTKSGSRTRPRLEACTPSWQTPGVPMVT